MSTQYGNEEKQWMSAWGFFGCQLLWAIPVIGWILWLCAALSGEKSCKRSFARSYLCALFIVIVLVVAVFLLGYGEVLTEAISGYLS